MDAVPGLVAVGQTDAGWLWRISPLNQPVIGAADVAHRVRIVDGAGANRRSAALRGRHGRRGRARRPGRPPGGPGRAFRPGWSAWVDGRRLTATSSDWAQAFTLPAQGGKLTIRYENPWALWTGIAQAVVIGLTVLLAIPMPARRPNTGLSRDEGSLRKETSACMTRTRTSAQCLRIGPTPPGRPRPPRRKQNGTGADAAAARAAPRSRPGPGEKPLGCRRRHPLRRAAGRGRRRPRRGGGTFPAGSWQPPARGTPGRGARREQPGHLPGTARLLEGAPVGTDRSSARNRPPPRAR